MPITRELVLKILKYLLDNSSFSFPFKIVCTNFDKDYELYDIEFSQEMLDEVLENDKFKDFELVENLQNLDSDTLQLMSKGFIEKIINNEAVQHIADLAKEYRSQYKEELWESTDIEKFGFNEYIGGKAEAYEECLEILKKLNKFNQ